MDSLSGSGQRSLNYTHRTLNYKQRTLNYALWLIVLFLQIYPHSLNAVLPVQLVHMLLYAGMCLSAVLGVFFYIRYDHVDRFMLVMVAYCSVMLISTLVNHGNFLAVFVYQVEFSFVRIVGLCATLSFLVKADGKHFVDLLFKYYFVLVVLNLITIILFPGGMYVTGQDGNYILGLDNGHSTTFFLLIALSLCRDWMHGLNDFSEATWCAVVLINTSAFLCMSANTVVQMVLFDAILLFRKRLITAKWFTPYTAVLLNMFFTLYLIFFFTVMGNTWINDIAVNIFHKDVTFSGRTYLWAKAVQSIARRPWIGYGWDFSAATARMGAYHAHNQYLTDLYYGGIPMLSLLMALVLMTAAKINGIVKKNRNALGIGFIGVLFATVFHWNAESLHTILQLATLTLIYHLDRLPKRSVPSAGVRRRLVFRFR